jgi:predicted Zn-dependent protease
MQPRKILCSWTGFVPALFLGISLSACESSQKKASDAAMLAQQQAEAGDFIGAGQNLRRAVQLRDDDSAIWLLLGQVEQRNGHLPEAFAAYNRSDELKPGNADTLRAIAYSGYMIGAIKDAGDAADRLLSLAPSDTAALSVKGLIALDSRDTKAALEAAEAILRANPADETGILLKARAMAVAGDVDSAQTLIRETMAQRGESSGLTALALQIDRLAGNAKGVGATFPALLKLSPDNSDLYVDYANFLYKTGDPVKARAILAEGMVKERRNGPYLTWAFRVLDQFEPTNVPPRLDPKIAKAPASLLRTAAARYLLDRGDAAGAASLVSPQGSIDPRDRGLYAAALDAMGRRKDAEAIVTELLANVGNNPDPEALILRARWSLAAGKPDKAAIDAQTAVLTDSTIARARVVLAQAYAAKGDDARVRQILTQATQELPSNRRILMVLLDFLQKKGDKDGMMAAVRAFADANPADPGSWDMVANFCAVQRNTACVETARARQRVAQTDYDMPNPNRPNIERGLFSPLKRKT